jgi:hypothetical protein
MPARELVARMTDVFMCLFYNLVAILRKWKSTVVSGRDGTGGPAQVPEDKLMVMPVDEASRD